MLCSENRKHRETVLGFVTAIDDVVYIPDADARQRVGRRSFL